MAAVVVKASRGGELHRFSIPPASPTIKYPTFQSLCEALVYNLSLPTNAAAFADASRAPFDILFRDDEGDYCNIFDDLSLREAITLSRQPLRLKVRVPRRNGRPQPPTEVQEEVLADSVRADGHCDPPVHVFSPTSLLRLLKHLRNEGSSSVRGALADLDRCIQCHPGDAAALRRRRHEVARLFSAFLAEAALPGESRIPNRLTTPLIDNLTASLQRAGVNKHITRAATRAVSIVCNCKPAVELLRSRYADAVCRAAVKRSEADADPASSPDVAVAQASTAVMATTVVHSETRPVKHYINQFTRMRRVGGPEVKEAYRRFEHARRRAGDMPAFDLTRKVCKSIQRASFHFLRCHVSSSDFEFEQRAVKALAASVARKLRRAGYDEKLVDVTMQLVAAMAMDDEVIRLAYKWANRPKHESPEEEVAADVAEPDDSGELEEMALAAELERMRIEALGKSLSNPSLRPQSVHEEEEEEEEGGDVYSNESLASVDSLHEGEELAQSQAMKKKMNEISPVHSSEDLNPDGGNDGNGSGSEAPKSTDTDRSQWARVQMEKEREEQLRKARRLDKEREMQMARERQVEIDLARERRREEEIERQMDRVSRGSQRRSRGPSLTGSVRGPGGSVREGSVRGSVREGSTRGSHRSLSIRAREAGEHERSRAGSAYMHEDPREAPESFHSGNIDPREEISVRGSERRSVRSSRSRGRSNTSARGSVSRSRHESREGGSAASSRRGSRRYEN